ncbi:MAG: protein kinase [Anaerolineae bacterium]
MNQESSFGSIVREHRRLRDLTQAELGRRVGCAVITIRRIEAGTLRPSQQIAERLAMALGIPLEERAAFIRLARTASPAEPSPSPLPTPPVLPEEIGLEDLSGRAIRGYALGERLGVGGYGAVYRAMQPLVEREVAIKIILPQYADHPDFIRRFEAEAQLVARLEHPHIVPLYDYWREPGVAYLVMRLLRGGSLAGLLKDGPLPLPAIGQILEQIGVALHTAHQMGIIHRDLKPANVLLDEHGNAYLADFGIAKNLGNPNLADVTQPGVVIGSPAYFSPEQILAEPVRPQSDIYCLGIMLYELLTGCKPFDSPSPIFLIQQHLNETVPPLAASTSGLPPALDPVIQKATAKEQAERYSDVLNLLEDFRKAAGAQGRRGAEEIFSPLLPRTPAPLLELTNPYKGLRAFTEADAADFFGRETLVQELLRRMSEVGDPTTPTLNQELARFLAVVGPSGSGKSSVVRAGLIPALRQGGLPNSDRWFVVEMLPGTHPWEELEAALLRVAVNPPDSLLIQLREDERGLLRAIRRILPPDDTIELVLVIDQFEELFTLVADEDIRRHFLDTLVTAVLDPRSRLRLVITLRADFMDRPLRYVEFGELLRQRTEFVLPLAPEELEQAITGPAHRVGLALEPGLVEVISHDVGAEPGALPLLQYALTELFERSTENVERSTFNPQGASSVQRSTLLTKAAYQASGGVLGALARRADELYAGLDEAGQETARQLFLRLVTLGEGTEDTRRRVLHSELEALSRDSTPTLTLPLRGGGDSSSPSSSEGEGWGGGAVVDGQPSAVIGQVIDQFGRHRLLSFDHDPISRGPTVEVAHEALLREWGRLREWLDAGRNDIRMQRLLATAAAEWREAKQDASFLLRGTRLDQFAGWAEGTTLALTPGERAFLEASLADRELRRAEESARQRRELETAQKLAETEKHRAEEQTQAANRLRRRNQVITMAGVVTLILAILAGLLALQSNRNAAQATARELASAAQANLQVDPELSLLLALESISASQRIDTAPLAEAQEALHQAVQRSRLEFSLSGHSGDVTSLAFSPDGRWLASSSADSTVRLWDFAQKKEVAVLQGHEGAVNDLAFSPDGQWLATVGDDATLRLWNLATHQATVIPTGHMGWVISVAFNGDGTRLITTSRDGRVEVWDVVTAKSVLNFSCSGPDDDIYDSAFSPDGLMITLAHEKWGVTTWDATSGSVLAFLPDPVGADGYHAWSTAFSPDGTRMLSSYQTGMVKLWNMETGASVYTLYEAGSVLKVAFDATGKRLVTTSQDGTAKIWDTESGQELLTLYGHKSGVVAAAFSPDDNYLVTANGAEVKVWNISSTGGEEWLDLYGHEEQVTSLAYSPDGRHLVTGGVGRQVVAWNTESQEAEFKEFSFEKVQDIVFNPAGNSFAFVDGSTVVGWNLETKRKILKLSGHTDRVTSVVYRPDGKQLATGSLDGTAQVWDGLTGETILTLIQDGAPINDVAYNTTGEYLAAGNRNGLIIVWEIATGQLVKAWAGHQGAVSSLAFSPDAKYLATTGDDGLVKVWDASTFALLSTLTGHRGAIRDVAFSPDSAFLATASSDGTAKVWPLAGGEPVTLHGHRQGVERVAFSPDGQQLATAGQDGSVRVFVLGLEDLMTIARSRLTRTWTAEECQRFLHTEVCP